MFSFLPRILKFSLIFIAILLIIMVVVIETTLQPILHNVCKTDVTGMLTKIINQATKKTTSGLSYNDLITIETNRQGEIILMEPNLQIVNNIASDLTLNRDFI